MNKNIFLPYQYFIAMLISLFLTEVLIMHLFYFFPHMPNALEAFLDASLLSLITSPLLYIFWIRPRIIEHKKREKQYETIVQTSIDGFLITDMRGNLIDVNDSYCRMIGYSKEELLKMKISDVEVIEKPEDIQAHIRKVKEVGGDCFETRHKCKDGSIIDVEISVTFLKSVVQMFIFARDITNRKHLEKITIQSEKLAGIGQLAAGLAHEINNPLGVILGFAQSCSRHLQPNDPLELPIKSIEREANRVKTLVQGLLAFSRTSKIEREECNINKTIENALALADVNAKMNSVKLIREFEENLPQVVMNSSQIQQVIVNLCNNAVDAMPKGGAITLRTRRVQDLNKDAIQIQVQDTGPGIPKDIQMKMFEPFFTTKEVGKGTGLGLSISHEIIQKHGGTITFDSQMGIGTTFNIKIPLT